MVLGIMVFAAGFLVLRLGLHIKSGADKASLNYSNLTAQVRSAEDNLKIDRYSLDSDSDGILDFDESAYHTDPLVSDSDGDGFLDGEEVASGFNPTKDDKEAQLANKPPNMTDAFTERLLGGILAGDLGPKNENYGQNLNALALGTIDDAVRTLNPPTSQQQLLLSNNSKEAQEIYLQNISSVLNSSFINEFISQPYNMHKAAMLLIQGKSDEAAKVFGDLAISTTGAYTQLLTVPVPPKWQSFHNDLLGLLRKISTDHRLLGKINEDPMAAFAALNDFSSTISTIEFTIIQDLRSMIRQEELTAPQSKLFDLIGLLDNTN